MQTDKAQLDRLVEQLLSSGGASEPPNLPPPLNPPSGSGNSGGMEARVARLEAHVEHIQADLNKLAGVPADLASLKATVATLPDKDWVGTKLRNYLAIAVGVAALINAAISWGPKLLGQ